MVPVVNLEAQLQLWLFDSFRSVKFTCHLRIGYQRPSLPGLDAPPFGA